MQKFTNSFLMYFMIFFEDHSHAKIKFLYQSTLFNDVFHKLCKVASCNLYGVLRIWTRKKNQTGVIESGWSG